MIFYLVIFVFLFIMMIVDPIKVSNQIVVSNQGSSDLVPIQNSDTSFAPFFNNDNTSSNIQTNSEFDVAFDYEDVPQLQQQSDSYSGFNDNSGFNDIQLGAFENVDSTNSRSRSWWWIIIIILILLVLFIIYYYREWLWSLIKNEDTTNKNTEETQQRYIYPIAPKIQQFTGVLKEKVCKPCPTCDCPNCPSCDCPSCPTCVCPDNTVENKEANKEIEYLKWMVRHLGVQFRREDAVKKAIYMQCPGVFVPPPQELDYLVQNNLKIINKDAEMYNYFQNYFSTYTGIPKEDSKKIL